MTHEPSKNTIETVIAELQRLLTALDILKQVWAEVGPYRHSMVSEETVNKMREFFDFDDSE